jgi:glucokinase
VADLALAVDIGGTKIAAGLVTVDGSLVEREMQPTRAWAAPPPESEPGSVSGSVDEEEGGDGPGTGGLGRSGGEGDGELLWRELSGLIRGVTTAVERGDRLVVCGVGCGGPMTPGGDEVSPLNIPAWRSFPLRARLAELTGLPTFVDNDAKALALGEGWVGAAADHADYIGMVVSTGVGGGIVLNGRLLDGRLGNAGHVGHVIVVPGGRRRPGRRWRRSRASRPDWPAQRWSSGPARWSAGRSLR